MFKYTQILIFDILTKHSFLKYIRLCIYIYIVNKHSTHTFCKQKKKLFWRRFIAINRLTALIKMNYY